MPTRVLLVLIAIATVTGFDASRKMSLVAALLKGGKCLRRHPRERALMFSSHLIQLS